MRDDKNGLSHVFTAMGAIAFFVAAVPALDAMGTYVANWFGLKSVKLNHEAEEFVHEEDAVGVVEIILILVVLIGLVVIFKKQLTTLVKNILTKVTNQSNTI